MTSYDYNGLTKTVTNANGVCTSELRYREASCRRPSSEGKDKAFGETRFSYGTMPTKYTFTGQYSYTDDPSTPGVTEGFGLMFFNARWMDPSLGRFAQPDSIVPTQTQGTQAWDRYAFVNNNPVRYNDPTGHGVDCGFGESCVGNPTNPNDLAPNGKDIDGGGDSEDEGDDESEDPCYQHISDNYWANICGGEDGSEFTQIFFTNPGHEGYWLGVTYDSPIRAFIEALLNIIAALFPFPQVRAAWKANIVNGTQMVTDAMLDSSSRGDAWDDTLGGAISNAGDYGSGNVNLFIFQNVYNRVAISNRGQGPAVFSPSTRFVVVVQAAGKSSYLPIYISNVYQSDFNSYWGIP